MAIKDQQQKLNRARRLHANGVPLKIDQEDRNAGLLMRQVGAETVNRAFDLKGGRPGYILEMNIIITQKIFTIEGITLELPWTDYGLSLIDDPRVSGARYDHYWFPRTDLAFERAEVINHIVNAQPLLRHGKSINGLLLWVGSIPIPEAFVHGVPFPASVIITDEYDNPHKCEVSFWADRRELEPRGQRKAKSRPSLFSKRDETSGVAGRMR